MRVKITLGQDRVNDGSLTSIYSNNGIQINTDLLDLPYKLNDNNGNHLYVIGKVVNLEGHSTVLEYEATLLNKSVVEMNNILEGAFIIIKISNNNKCEISCDKYARSDLFYICNEAFIEFSTDLSDLTTKSNNYNQVAIGHSLYIYGYRPAKQDTLYEGVARLGVGEVATWTNGKVEFETTQPEIYSCVDYGEEKLVEYSEIFLSAIKKCSSDRGNIVYLSSGWDSTAILGALVKLHGSKNVRAIIGRMHYSERAGIINTFELERAKAVANYYDVNLEVVEFDYYKRGPELVEKYQPLMRSQMLSSMTFFNHALLAEHIEAQYNGEAVFCGEISDGVHNLGFSQFVTQFHPVQDFREYSDKMASYLFGPSFYKSIQANTYEDDFVYRSLKNRQLDVKYDVYDKSDPSLQLLSSFFLRDNRFPMWSILNNDMFTEYGGLKYEDEMQNKYLRNAAQNMNEDNLYSWYIHLYNSFHWQGGTVATLNHTANANGFEIQLPFWDRELHEFLSKMPESWGRGLDFNRTKYPLKWMLQNYIDYPNHLQVGPHSYLYDVDHSFSHAAEFIYASAFTSLFKDIVRKRKYREILLSDYFNLRYIDKIIDNYLIGQEASGSERNNLVAIIFLSLEII